MSSEMISIGDKLRLHEKNSETCPSIKKENSFIVRLDGRCFSTKTKSLIKPFDKSFSNAMLKTCADLIKEFHCATIFVQSDEISLLFSKTEHEHIFGGKVRKILSILAGFTSTRFTVNFINELKLSLADEDPKYISNHTIYLEKLDGDDKFSIKNASFCFDARIIIIPESEPELAAEIFFWRSVCDGYRNYVSGLSFHYLSKKQIKGISLKERILMLKNKEIDIDNEPGYLKYGWYVKMSKRFTETEHGTAERNFPCAKSFKIAIGSSYLDLLYSKFWSNNNIMFFEEEDIK